MKVLSLRVIVAACGSLPEAPGYSVAIAVPEMNVTRCNSSKLNCHPGKVQLPTIPQRRPRIALISVRTAAHESVRLSIDSSNRQVETPSRNLEVCLFYC